MSRIRESLVVLLDVSPTMHAYIDDLKTAISTLIRRKIFYTKNDEVGIVVFGADGPENELHTTLGGYESVVVLQPVKVVDQAHLEAIDNLNKGNGLGDYLDAIVVGMDLLIKRCGPGTKGNKRLFLITDAESLIKEPFEGTKNDQVGLIAQKMRDHGMKFDVAIYQPRHSRLKQSQVFMDNLSLLKSFPETALSQVIIVENSNALLGVIKPRNVTAVTTFRGDLEVTPMFRIKVWVYKKTYQERMPYLKKYSDKAPASDQSATREVKLDIEYKSKEDPDKSIPPDQRIKGFYYGPQVIPISSIQQEALKFKAEKGVKILGFTQASNIPRHYYMKDVSIFTPEPGNPKATVAVSAIAKAMKKTGKVAVTRCVWRQGQANVVLGVLTPNLSDSENIADSFYFNVIPFAEDVREFPFASFHTLPPSKQPNISQQHAADDLVQMFDLAPSGRQEILNPDFTLNPLLERFFRFVDMKSRKSSSSVPPLDDILKKIVEPDPEIVSKADYSIRRLCSEFQLNINAKKDKVGKSFWRDKPPTSEEVAKSTDDSSAAQSEITFESLTAKKADKVGSLTPVQDFEALLARRDSDEWVPKAIKEMKKFITDLLEMSYKGSGYEKILDCLMALRKGCVQQEEPGEFNSLMQELKKKCHSKRFQDFWELIISNGITLIYTNEAADSEVSEKEAKDFLEMGLQPQAQEEPEVDEMEELLGVVV